MNALNGNMKTVTPAGPALPEREEEETELCLLCCSKVISEGNKNASGLFGNLRIVFLLRNLLQVPDTQLERNLEEWGNPENWIRLCDPCSQLTRQAEDLHCQIVKIERELRNVRKLIVDKTRLLSSSTTESCGPGDGLSALINKKNEKISIWRSTREFVSKHDYGSSTIALSNPFIDGDSQANYLQSLQDNKAISLTIQIPEGHVFLDDNANDNSNCSEIGKDDDDDDNWKPESAKVRQRPDHPRPPKRNKCRRIEKVNGKFQCRHCNRLFNTRSGHYAHEVAKHMSRTTKTTKTTESGKWKCHFCNEEFELCKERIAHEEDKHVSSNGDFKCDICGKSRATVKRLLQHKRWVHKLSWGGEILPPLTPTFVPKEPQTCELCGKIYSSRMGLTNHLRLIHERRSKWFCQFCGFRASSEPGLIRHMFGKHKEEEETKKMVEEGIKVWKCEVVGCNASYMKEKGLERHTDKYHQGGGGGGGDKEGMGEEAAKRWACSFCGKGFWLWNKLNRHEEIHWLDGEKPWKCDKCGGAFSTKQYLRDHVRRVHEINKDNDDNNDN